MEITPQHLGEKWRSELLKRRALSRVRQKMGYIGVGGETTYDEPKRRPRSTRLQRFWLRPANLSGKDAADIAPLLTAQNTGVSVWRNLATTFSVSFVFWFVAMILIAMLSSANYDGAISTVYWFTAVSLAAPVLWLAWATQTTFLAPRRALRNINTDAVTEAEVEAFLPTVRGDLDRSYLNTVLDAVRQPNPVPAGQTIGQALREIGDVVSALPGEPLPVGADDALSFRTAADTKRTQAGRETDSVLAASLLRQASADEKQAQIADGAGKAARRARARHDEAAANLQVLRAVLTSHAADETAARLSIHGDAVPFAVREAANGAVAASQAKRELEDSEIAALYGQPVPAPIQSVAATATSGKWWR